MKKPNPAPFFATLLFPLIAASTAFLAGCDGEAVDYSGARYDLQWTRDGGSRNYDGDAAAPGEPGAAGVYGTAGVAAASNQPGARNGAAVWQDAAGNAWLFGGKGLDTGVDKEVLQDLWKFDITTKQWMWVSGKNVIGNSLSNPGKGEYGTRGIPADANLPGARTDAVAWTDSTGHLWLFGGTGVDGAGGYGRLNDLWKFDAALGAAGQWAWMAGDTTINSAGNYGAPATKNIANDTNQPGARDSATGWADSTGALWLFGGDGRDSAGNCCLLNDLWKFDPALGTYGQWIWISGSTLRDGAATYGSQGIADAANTPSGRFGANSWYDSAGSAWLYGGIHSPASGTRFVSAELWRYTAAGWTWVSGTQSSFVTPVYNGRGLPALSSTPGSRGRSITWIHNGLLYLFAGDVEAANGSVTHPNDLWMFNGLAWAWLGGFAGDNANGTYNAIGATGKPGGRANGAGWIDAAGNLWLFGGEVVVNSTTKRNRNDLWHIAL